MGNYISFTDLEDRLSQAVVRRIYDDDNDGEPDGGPLLRVIRDAENWFEAVAISVYPDLTSLRANGGPNASTIVLDCAEALAAKRFPRAVNRDWIPLLNEAKSQLKDLRTGVIKLPVQGPPNPPANVGGGVFAGTSAEAMDPIEPTFLNDWGRY